MNFLSTGISCYVLEVDQYISLVHHITWHGKQFFLGCFPRKEAAAEVIFHELAHQKIYITDDTSFNEAFAVAISHHGVDKWFKHSGDQKSAAEYQALTQRRIEFRRLMLDTRASLKKLYSTNISEQEMRQRKKETFNQMQQNYKKLKAAWNGYDGYDNWMAQGLNNAHLSLIATYHKLVPPLLKLIETCGNDLPRFYRQVERWKKLKPEARMKRLHENKCAQ